MRNYKTMSADGVVSALKRGTILRGIGFGAAVFIAVLSVLAYWYQVLSIISVLTFFVASILFFRLMARMRKLRYGKVELVLLDDCDCTKYVEIYQAIRSKKPEKSQLDTISIAKGCFFMGDFQRAKKELESVNTETLKGAAWVPYYNVAIQNYLELGELQHAKEIRQEIEKYAARQKAGSPASKLAAQLEKFADFAGAFRRKDYETARRLQEDILHMSSHAAQLSLLYYRMGVMELEAGQMEEAKEHLDYVVRYGGQVFVKEPARRLLEEQFGDGEYLLPEGKEEE